MLRKGEGEGNTSDSGRDAAQWLIRQDINVSDYREANLKALDILMKGVDSLGFIISDPESVSEDNISVLLDGIEPCGAEINFLPNGKAREIIAALKSIMQRKGINPSFLRGAVEADPLGLLMADGSLCIPLEDGLDYLASLTQQDQSPAIVQEYPDRGFPLYRFGLQHRSGTGFLLLDGSGIPGTAY